MSADLYGDASLRSPDDLDFLVPWTGIPGAIAALERELFSPKPRLSSACLRVLRRSECDLLMTRAEPSLHLELHWDIVPPWYGLKSDPEGIIGRAGSLETDGHSIRVPCAEDLLLCLCVNGAKDGWRKLEMVAAVSALCARRPGLDWDAVARRAIDWGAGQMLLLGLNLARQLLEADFPEELKAAIRGDRAARRMTREALQRIFQFTAGDGETARPARFRRRTLQNHYSRLRHIILRGLTPTFADVEFLKHADLPLLIYAAVRPARLLAAGVANTVRRFAGDRGR
jgi:hypothetical protein